MVKEALEIGGAPSAEVVSELMTSNSARWKSWRSSNPEHIKFDIHLRQSALVRAWAGLEALAQDAWIDTINRSPVLLLHKYLEEVAGNDLGGENGVLVGRKISIAELRGCDFDLTRKLGTFLSRNCSFKTVNGINRAYGSAFKWSQPAPQINVEGLTRVEHARHCIVHRGGIVDFEYLRQVKDSKYKRGDLLDVDMMKDMEMILEAGNDLMTDLVRIVEEHGIE